MLLLDRNRTKRDRERIFTKFFLREAFLVSVEKCFSLLQILGQNTLCKTLFWKLGPQRNTHTQNKIVQGQIYSVLLFVCFCFVFFF